MSDNVIIVSGNCTKDPELRFLSNGQAKVSFSVATNRRYQVNGEWREDVTYHDVVAWRKLGENVAASVKKGNRVTVTGRLSKRSYEASDGSGTRYVTEIEADDVSASLKYATAEIVRNPREDGAGEYRKPAASAAASAAMEDDPF